MPALEPGRPPQPGQDLARHLPHRTVVRHHVVLHAVGGRCAYLLRGPAKVVRAAGRYVGPEPALERVGHLRRDRALAHAEGARQQHGGEIAIAHASGRRCTVPVKSATVRPPSVSTVTSYVAALRPSETSRALATSVSPARTRRVKWMVATRATA